MKELSIEDKAARYDKAIEVAKRNYDAIVEMDENCTFAKSGIINTFHRMFPELKESEDERIRKYLLNLAERCPEDSIDFMSEVKKEDVIAYLERRKPTTDIQNLTWEDIAKIEEIIDMVQHENLYGIGAKCFYTDVLERFLDGKQTKQKVINDTDEDIVEQKPYGQIAECLDCQFNYAGECKGSCAMKRGEQKPADKVEPKFKVGDWVMLDRPVLITKVEDMPYNTHQYWTSDGTWFGDATKAKLWTIQDAKDGDVLKEDSCTFIVEKMNTDGTAIVHCCLFDDGDFNSGFTLCFDPDSTYPATKEQCGLLFQWMKEAGYEWDAEKKELKKVEQNSAWSEEDEEIVSFLNALCIDAQNPNNCASHSMYYKEVEKAKDWLNSLKDRVNPQWKPSSQHIAALEYQVNSTCKGSWQYKASKELLEQLKQL